MTRPAPTRAAAPAHSTGAPRKWSEPATTSDPPEAVLVRVQWPRAGPVARSVGSSRIVYGRSPSAPRGCRSRARSSRPTRSAAGKRSRPCLTPPRVTVVSAHTASPGTVARVGVDAARQVQRDHVQRALGRSFSCVASDASGSRSAPCVPMPASASRRRVAAAQRPLDARRDPQLARPRAPSGPQLRQLVRS